jgi:hypothetical protein
MQTQNFARIEQGVMNVTLETMVRLALLFEVEVRELLRAPKTRPLGLPIEGSRGRGVKGSREGQKGK